MFFDIKGLFSPEMMQKANISLYQWIKLSLYMSLYAIPWVIVNTLFILTKETFLLFVLAFLFVIPNIVAAFYFSDKTIHFREYSHYLKRTYIDSLKNGLFIMGVLLFFGFDGYVVLSLMKLGYLFPLLYITSLFITIWAVYFLYFQQQKEFLFKKNVKLAMFFSWRYVLLSFSIFLLIMLWLSLGYFLQGLNLLVGNGLVWGIIARLIYRRVEKNSK